MATQKLDATGLSCPQPILKIVAKMPEMAPGDILEVTADCASFEDDVRKWCERMRKTVLAVNTNGSVKIAQIKF